MAALRHNVRRKKQRSLLGNIVYSGWSLLVLQDRRLGASGTAHVLADCIHFHGHMVRLGGLSEEKRSSLEIYDNHLMPAIQY